MPALLVQAGCSVDVMSAAETFIAHSSSVAGHIRAPESLDDFLVFLKAHLQARHTDYAWIMVGDDPVMYALGRLRHEPWARSLLPCNATDGCIDFLVSKLDFLVQASEAKLPVPPYMLCSDSPALQAAADSLGFPLVVKQREGFGGKTVSIVESRDALQQLVFDEAVIAQAFVPGRLGSASVYFDHGRLIGFFSYFRERTWGQKGASTAVVFHAFPEMEVILHKLGQLSGFHGLCGIDFIQHEKTGQLVLLEQNFRPTLTVLLGHRVGVDLGALIYQTIRGQLVTPVVKQTPSNLGAVPLFPIDVLRAIDEKDLKGLGQWLLKPSWWPEMNWQDGKLLRYNLRYVMRFLVAKVLRQLGLKQAS